MKIKLLLLTTLLVSFLGSCVTPRDTNLLQDIPKNYPIDVNLNNDYKVIPGDQLIFRWDSQDSLSRKNIRRGIYHTGNKKTL